MTAVLAVALGLGTSAMLSGCSGPYSGKAERLKRPKKKERPPAEDTGAQEVVLDEECRTDFFQPPVTRRNARRGRALATEAQGILERSEAQEDDAARVRDVGYALDKLRNALKHDPYGPEPTYRMAVAYAVIGKKGCALRLLERLDALTRMPETTAEAERAVKRALRDPSFDLFRKEANLSLGR